MQPEKTLALGLIAGAAQRDLIYAVLRRMIKATLTEKVNSLFDDNLCAHDEGVGIRDNNKIRHSFNPG
jgi:hypothetical protein